MRRPKVTATACSNLLSEAMLSSRLMSTYFLAMQCQCNAVLLPAGTAREGNNWIYIMGYRELIISIALYHLHQPRCLAWANVDMVFKNQGEAPLVYLLIFLGHFTKTFGCIFMIVHTLFIFVQKRRYTTGRISTLTLRLPRRSPWSSRGSSCSFPCAAWSPGLESLYTSQLWTPPWR